MGVSKVIYGGNVLIDLTGDTVTADKLLTGYKAHGADGEVVNGECDFDANTQDATASAAEILSTKVAYNKGNRITGSMKNNGAVSGTINSKAGKYTVPQGYHDGSGTVQISATEQAKLTPDNIRKDITILGVTGTMSGLDEETPQSRTVDPTIEGFTVLPEEGFTCLSEVIINPIPYKETDNSAGGKTVTIG